jgi:hypothetical protein
VPANWAAEASFLRPSGQGDARDAASLTMPQLDFAFRRAWALALLAGLVASACGVLLGVQVRGELQDRAGLQAERAALEPTRALLDALRLTPRHRALAASVLGGDEAAERPRRALQAELDDAFARVAWQLEQVAVAPAAQSDWAEARQRWASLANAVGRRALAIADSQARHGELIEAQLDVHDRLAEGPGRAVDGPWLPLWSRYRGLVKLAGRAPALAAPADGADTTEAAAMQALQQLVARLGHQAGRLEQGLVQVERRAAIMATSGLGLLLLGLGLLVQALRLARRQGAGSARDGRPDVGAWTVTAGSPADIGRRVVNGLARPVAGPPSPTPGALAAPRPGAPAEAEHPAHRG